MPMHAGYMSAIYMEGVVESDAEDGGALQRQAVES